jgi:hypothetical protein
MSRTRAHIALASKILWAAAAVTPLVVASCGHDSLLMIDVIGDQVYSPVTLTLTAAGTTKVYPMVTIQPTAALQVGLYLPSSVSGTVQVMGAVDDGHCQLGTGSVTFTGIKQGTSSGEKTLIIMHAANCVPVGTGGAGGNLTGAGGAGGLGAGGFVGQLGGFLGQLGGTTGAGGFTVTGAGGFTGSSGGFTGGAGGFTGSSGGFTGGSGGFTGGTGGVTGAGGAGGDPGCAIVQCPDGTSSCCQYWFSFALDPPSLGSASRSDILGTFVDSNAVVSQSFGFDYVSQVGAIGVQLNGKMSISSLYFSGGQTGPAMPIYASFESASGDAGCLYPLNPGGFQTIDATTVDGVCRGNYPVGQAEKINIRMDSTMAGNATMNVTSIIIRP